MATDHPVVDDSTENGVNSGGGGSAAPAAGAGLRDLLRWRPHSRFGWFVFDAIVVSVLPLAVLLAFGVNQWVLPYSPDSDFYVGLSGFGNAVVERALDPAYYWTRIGVIGPTHFLVSNFGVDVGYALWRIFLLVVTVLPVFLLVKPRFGRAAAIAGVLVVATNTTVIVTLVDVYPSAGVLAGFSVLTCSGCLALQGTRPTRRTISAAAVAGAAVGWIISSHFGVLAVLGGSCLALFGLSIVRYRLQSWRVLLALAGTALSVFGLFQLWLQALFPRRNWFTANLEAVTATDWSFYHEKTYTWLTTDPNLLVIPLALVLGVIASTRKSRARSAVFATTLMLASASVLSCVQQFLLGGQNLQLPYYYTQLWPLAVLLITLSVLVLTTAQWQRYVLIAVGAVALPLAGMSQWVFTWFWWALAIAVLLIIAYGSAFVVSSRDSTSRARGAVVIALISVTLTGVQILQNGLGITQGLIIGRSPAHQAFADPIAPWQRSYFDLAVQVEGWVIENTPATRMVTWVGTDDRAVWGAVFVAVDNSAMINRGPDPSAEQLRLLRSRKPGYLAMTSSSIDQSRKFIAQIPADVATADVYACQEFWEADLHAATCLARLTYPSKRSVPKPQ